MSDVTITIPADQAREFARVLRGPLAGLGRDHMTALADLLDPPAPSLRDEVLERIDNGTAHRYDADHITDVVLAVVRRHVEAMPVWGGVGGDPDWLVRDDVLRLLGGAE